MSSATFGKTKRDNIDLKHLLVAQFNLKKELTRKINREIKHAKDGKPAWMILKMNGLDNQENDR